ncbi:MAG: BamA/TamA family outer membrane protein [Aphanocapsa sp. GSE-SYN-MK-11-07L]|nr:BamA/TamA family outer membrane protein [Aphanocapsa sp. GSE-SYN-MK-11-07L]
MPLASKLIAPLTVLAASAFVLPAWSQTPETLPSPPSETAPSTVPASPPEVTPPTPPTPPPPSETTAPEAAPTAPPDPTAPGTPPTTPPDAATPGAPATTAPPTTAPAPGAAPPAPPVTTTPDPNEPKVLVSEVVVQGATPELEQVVYQAISTRPGQTATRSQLQQDTNAIFATGYFADVKAEPSDTPLGVRVTFLVQSYPVLRSVQVAGNQVLTQDKVNEIFTQQYGQTLNLRQLQQGIEQINKYYQDNGFVLGQVIGSPQVDSDGTVTLQVAEGIVEEIKPRFLDKENKPAKGRTRDYIITRELRTKPGDVLNRDRVQADLRRLFDLGLFEDVQVALEPGQDPRKVNLVLNVKEKNTGSISAGAGFSSAAGLFGTASYQQTNLFGRNQKFSAEVQAGTEGEFLFDLGFTDPWIKGDPYRTSYTVNVFNRLSQPFVFQGGDRDVNLANGDNPLVNRLGAGVTFSRPLTKDPDKIRTSWVASLGVQYQRVSTRDGDLAIFSTDELGNCLTVSCTGQDDLLTVQAAAVRDLRNDPVKTTKGSLIRVGAIQSIPVGTGSIFMTQLRGSYSFFIPVSLLKFSKGGQTLAFNVQAGTILGDAPPYEAFTLGGSNSVRGYGEGELGTGRTFLQGTAEYRFPLFNIVGGALFVDAATLFDTQGDVIGQPGAVRGKPGSGVGYGLGVRVNTPLGNVRIDYGFNDQGGSQLSFGIGERF